MLEKRLIVQAGGTSGGVMDKKATELLDEDEGEGGPNSGPEEEEGGKRTQDPADFDAASLLCAGGGGDDNDDDHSLNASQGQGARTHTYSTRTHTADQEHYAFGHEVVMKALEARIGFDGEMVPAFIYKVRYF